MTWKKRPQLDEYAQLRDDLIKFYFLLVGTQSNLSDARMWRATEAMAVELAQYELEIDPDSSIDEFEWGMISGSFYYSAEIARRQNDRSLTVYQFLTACIDITVDLIEDIDNIMILLKEDGYDDPN